MDYILAAFLAVVCAFHVYEARTWRKERSDLLNRIMARSYQEFVYSPPTSSVEPDRPQMTSDAAEAAYAQEQEGIDREWHERNAREHPDQYPEGLEGVA